MMLAACGELVPRLPGVDVQFDADALPADSPYGTDRRHDVQTR